MTFQLLIRSCVYKDTTGQVRNNDKTEYHKKTKILKKVLFKNLKHLSDLISQTFQQFSGQDSLQKIRSILNLWCCVISSMFSLRQGDIKEDFLSALYSYIDFSWFSSYARFSTRNDKTDIEPTGYLQAFLIFLVSPSSQKNR